MKTRPSFALLVVGIILTASSVRAQTVNVSASPSTITNEGEESTITLTISPPPARNIAVNFAMTGTARLGSDYVLIGDFDTMGRVLIAAGQSTSTITLHALFDDDGHFNETTVFNIIGGNRYRIGRPSHVQVTIQNQP